jgi:hypothetical protein
MSYEGTGHLFLSESRHVSPFSTFFVFRYSTVPFATFLSSYSAFFSLASFCLLSSLSSICPIVPLLYISFGSLTSMISHGVVGVAISYWLDGPGSNPVCGKTFFSSLKDPDLLWVQTSLLFNFINWWTLRFLLLNDCRIYIAAQGAGGGGQLWTVTWCLERKWSWPISTYC